MLVEISSKVPQKHGKHSLNLQYSMKHSLNFCVSLQLLTSTQLVSSPVKFFFSSDLKCYTSLSSHERIQSTAE